LADPATAAACRSVVERFWNPGYQRCAIERAVLGQPADDLFDRREPMQHSGHIRAK
jgi:hypothetical protein